jgi:hypothetical protein
MQQKWVVHQVEVPHPLPLRSLVSLARGPQTPAFQGQDIRPTGRQSRPLFSLTNQSLPSIPPARWIRPPGYAAGRAVSALEALGNSQALIREECTTA